MESWAWLVAYVVGFGLLQLLLYRYFRQSAPTPEPTDGRVERGRAGPAQTDETDEVVACPNCGVINEGHLMIRYCGACTEPLR